MAELKNLSRATIADVARHAGVSIATVSRVINGTAPVTAETAARVQAAIAELAYIPQAAARDLASGKTNTLGLFLSEISGDFIPPMLRGIEAGAREHGFDLLIYTTQARSSSSAEFRRPLSKHNTDGLLIFADSLDEAELTRLYKLGLPMVLLHRSPPDTLDIPYVTFENKSGARQLVDHLINAHGYRRIAFLRGPEGHEDSYWRELGYREALEAHGIPFDPSLVARGGFDEEEAQAPVERWLAEGLDIDAIFAGDDEAASGVIIALRRAGKRVPEDIAVVGFDDVPLSRHLTPPLTTVRAPIEEAGHAAVRQLVQLIHTGHAEPAMQLLPTKLVIRHSCGCS